MIFWVKHVGMRLVVLRRFGNAVALLKVYKKVFSFAFFRLFFACVFVAKHFNIFPVFPTKSKARRGVQTTEVPDLEFRGNNSAGGGEGAARG